MHAAYFWAGKKAVNRQPLVEHMTVCVVGGDGATTNVAGKSEERLNVR